VCGPDLWAGRTSPTSIAVWLRWNADCSSLEASPGNIWERGIQPRINDQFILEYAKKFGSTNEEKHTYFVREQQTLASLFSASAMPKVALNNDASIESLCDRAKAFWIDRQ
jgi:hypothetical protein